jgi:hypothetical protein
MVTSDAKRRVGMVRSGGWVRTVGDRLGVEGVVQHLVGRGRVGWLGIGLLGHV